MMKEMRRKMAGIIIRPAERRDAAFLSWLILTAGRAHVKRGIWEVILGMPEEQCLHFLGLLSVTVVPHFFHHSCYLLGEAELMTFFVECGNSLTVNYGDMDEAFYDALNSMYRRAIKKALTLPEERQDEFREREI
jgi:hypothetical protein